MSGIRKTKKQKTLNKLNEKYNLGLTQQKISRMSTAELSKMIFDTKKKHGLTIKKSTKLLRGNTS